MSEVISFRLDKDNPREAKALNILHNWQDDGYRTREILIRALLQMDKTLSISDAIVTLDTKLDTLGKTLDRINLIQSDDTLESYNNGELSEPFLESIKKNIRPGIKTTGL